MICNHFRRGKSDLKGARGKGANRNDRVLLNSREQKQYNSVLNLNIKIRCLSQDWLSGSRSLQKWDMHRNRITLPQGADTRASEVVVGSLDVSK